MMTVLPMQQLPLCVRTYGAYPQVKVHKKPNGGKASALNYGIQLAETDIIVAIDGDTMLLPDAIEMLTDRMVMILQSGQWRAACWSGTPLAL